jgi:hypothetical protein
MARVAFLTTAARLTKRGFHGVANRNLLRHRDGKVSNPATTENTETTLMAQAIGCLAGMTAS